MTTSVLEKHNEELSSSITKEKLRPIEMKESISSPKMKIEEELKTVSCQIL